METLRNNKLNNNPSNQDATGHKTTSEKTVFIPFDTKWPQAAQED